MGVRAAVEKASRTLSLSSGKVVYCLHELVHNEQVVADLKARGLRFVESLDEVPDGATMLFSAHGVAPAVRDEAQRRELAVVDATCPFVARAHRAVREFAARGVPVVVVGRPEHAEVRGVMGECADARVVSTPDDVAALPFPEGPVGVVCQTTLSHDAVCAVLDALRARYPRLETPAAANVCTATRDRQRAVAGFVRGGGDGVLVLGSAGSSNTNRLVEVARAVGASFAARAGTLEEVRALDFAGVQRLGVTAGASTPEDFLERVIADFDILGPRRTGRHEKYRNRNVHGTCGVCAFRR